MSSTTPIIYTAVAILAVVLSLLFSLKSAPDDVCVSWDRPNPIADAYPNNATGVLNVTLAVIPIPLDTARRLIPARYAILEQAYRAVLPSFPEGMYPLLLQAAHDHDLQLKAWGLKLPDFTRVGFEFPFLDFLGDGYTSFRWVPEQLISSSSTLAILGSRAYGTAVFPATFDPGCNAYRRLPNGATYIRGSSHDGPARASAANSSAPRPLSSFKQAGSSSSSSDAVFAELEMSSLGADEHHPFPLEAFRNMTTQPVFANGSTCETMLRMFDTPLAQGQLAPVRVRGVVRTNLPSVARARLTQQQQQRDVVWTGVYGVQLATPFVEDNYLNCRSLQGR